MYSTPPPLEDRIIRERAERAPKGKKRPITGGDACKKEEARKGEEKDVLQINRRNQLKKVR